VVQGHAAYDSSADIWSFGITLLELAYGKPPYLNDLNGKYSPFKVLKRIMDEPPPQLSDDQSHSFSRAMRDLVGRCLHKEPSERPSAGQLLRHRFFAQAKGKEYVCSRLMAVSNGSSGRGGA
jgi:serine/threonine-protein kinase OSR1/STK39